jgi:solute carrier family 25 iron transporter 28/37
MLELTGLFNLLKTNHFQMEHTLLYPLDTVKTCWQSQVLHKVSGKPGCGPCEISSYVNPDSKPAVGGTISSNAPASASVSTIKKGSLGTYATTNASPPHSNSIWSTVKHLMKHSHHHGSHHAAGVTTLASQTHGMLAPNVVDMTNSAGKLVTQGRNHPHHSKTNRPWSKQSRMIRNATVADLAPTLAPSQFSSNVTSQSTTRSGIQRLFRGVQSMFVGCIPAHALYFSSYEIIKTMSLEYNKSNSSSTHCHGTMDGYQAMIAGGVATFLHDVVMTPMDTMKQRMQLGHYTSLRDAFESIVFGDMREGGMRAGGEGWWGLYRSFPITLVTNVPYGMIMMGTNEWLRGMLEHGMYGASHLRHIAGSDNEHREQPFHFSTIVLSGMGAGAVAAAMTAPLDRIKTRLQTQRMGMVLPPAMTGGGTAIMEEHALAAAIGEPKACPKMAMEDVKRTLFPSNSLVTAKPTATGSHHIPMKGHALNQTPFAKTFYTTPFEAFRSILQEEGPRGLFRGTIPRLALHAPSVAISWTAYELAKDWLVWWCEKH